MELILVVCSLIHVLTYPVKLAVRLPHLSDEDEDGLVGLQLDERAQLVGLAVPLVAAAAGAGGAGHDEAGTKRRLLKVQLRTFTSMAGYICQKKRR